MQKGTNQFTANGMGTGNLPFQGEAYISINKVDPNKSVLFVDKEKATPQLSFYLASDGTYINVKTMETL